MKPPHRRQETAYIAAFVADLGLAPVTCAVCWEAQGDALRFDDQRMVHTYGVGPMARTEQAAYLEVARQLSPKHLQLQFRASPWFHGNTFLAPFWSPQEQLVVMVCPDALGDGELERLQVFVPDAIVTLIDSATSLSYATNTLQVGDTLIAPTGLPEALLKGWRGLGFEVVSLGLSELFGRGGGAAVCLTNRLYGVGEELLASFPKQAKFAYRRDALAIS